MHVPELAQCSVRGLYAAFSRHNVPRPGQDFRSRARRRETAPVICLAARSGSHIGFCQPKSNGANREGLPWPVL